MVRLYAGLSLMIKQDLVLQRMTNVLQASVANLIARKCQGKKLLKM